MHGDHVILTRLSRGLRRHRLPRGSARKKILFVWEKFGPYHMDRCEACVQALGAEYEILGIEIASHSVTYGWAPSGPGQHFAKRTLFPGKSNGDLSRWRYFAALFSAALGSRAEFVFLCGYQFPPVFFTALLLRLMGRKLVVMQDSKFDDKPRRLLGEWLKVLLYSPYAAAFVGSRRSARYLSFLGFPSSRIFLGYDSLSVERLQRLAQSAPAPAGVPHAQRHFTIIARFVPEKNVSMAIRAHAAFLRLGGARDLVLCGAGPLEPALRAEVRDLCNSRVRFCGYLQEEGIAKLLVTSLALILPSLQEPFGLVVNEAIALGVPLLVSENCGARDALVRSGVNGYVFEPDNVEGLAAMMRLLDGDAAEWARLARNTRDFLPLADTAYFVRGMAEIIAALSSRAPRHRDRTLP